MSRDNNQLICYTIGHSTHETEALLRLLQKNNIDSVVDVRSSPYSRYNHQYNKETIKADLQKNGFTYVFMGDLLGARYSDPALFFNETYMVDFKKVRETDNFKKGIERVINGINRGHNIALMCAEKDPFDCHRFVLVSYALTKKSITVQHILETGETILNEQLEEKLLSEYAINYNQMSLFDKRKTQDAAVEEGYEKRNRDIGYVNI
jgi:uncharacterized protein (DUF488 family)